MRISIPLLTAALLPFAWAHGQTNAAPQPVTPRSYGVPASHAQIPPLHEAWENEHDPAKRSDLAGQLMDAVIHDYDEQPVDIADEVTRNGLPQKIIAAPSATSVAIRPLQVLEGVRWSQWGGPQPVFRRIAKNRIEAWISKEGWLFDAGGRLLVDAHVPRRDGQGGEWFGAFLPDGRWITTDLWSNDRQLACFDPQSDPRWELPGTKLVSAFHTANPKAAQPDYLTPSVGWARADRTGHAWLACLGTNGSRGLVVVTPDRRVKGLPANTDVWQRVYPRAMGVRGFYISLFTSSDDGAVSVGREEAGHGVGVGWPVFSLSSEAPLTFENGEHDLWRIVINGGTSYFGFWPHSHSIYIGTERRDPTTQQVWFFDSKGRYEGQIDGAYLADAANASHLLVQAADGRVTEVVRDGTGGVAAVATRTFTWPDGTPGIPLALYDDLKLGFFLRGPGIVDQADNNANVARAKAEIVLARW